MKKKFIPMALLALAMGFTACSSDDATADGSKGQPAFAEGGYVKLAINLPSTASSRAANDQFDDGLASEYQVKNATLILFSGENEAGATFHSAYNLNVSMNMEGTTTDQITSTTKIVSKVADNATASTKLYAYVVLNNNGLVKLGDSATELTVNDKDFTNGTLSDLQAAVVKGGVSKFNATGFLMDNAPLATVAGGTNTPADANITTLVDFSNAVKKTQAEAEASPATEVNVERAVAKVTFQKGEGGELKGSDVNLKGYEDGQAKSYEIVGWDLDITNNTSYLARNYSTDWNLLKTGATDGTYRFIGSTPIRTGQPLYRTYWAEDPNYTNVTPTKDMFSYLPASKTAFTTKFGNDNPQYCMENTFDVANQNQDQTTRAIVQVKLFGGKDFYIFNGDKSQLYTNEEMIKRVQAAVVAWPEAVEWYKSLSNPSTSLDDSHIKVEFADRDVNTGVVYIKKITLSATVSGSSVEKAWAVAEESHKSDLNKALGVQDITCYAGGMAYYPIRIKHFGDDLTPWNSWEQGNDKPSAGNIYPSNNAANYLGRYGVVRNNWYDLSVASISGIGSAVVPSLDPSQNPAPNPGPDDELYNYIAVRINVLSWAKRTQSENL